MSLRHGFMVRQLCAGLARSASMSAFDKYMGRIPFSKSNREQRKRFKLPRLALPDQPVFAVHSWAVSPAELREALDALGGGDGGSATLRFSMSEMHDASEVLGEIFTCLHRWRLQPLSFAYGSRFTALCGASTCTSSVAFAPLLRLDGNCASSSHAVCAVVCCPQSEQDSNKRA